MLGLFSSSLKVSLEVVGETAFRSKNCTFLLLLLLELVAMLAAAALILPAIDWASRGGTMERM